MTWHQNVINLFYCPLFIPIGYIISCLNSVIYVIFVILSGYLLFAWGKAVHVE